MDMKAAIGMVFAVGIILCTCYIIYCIGGIVIATLKGRRKKTMRIYQIDDAEKIFGKATIYVQHGDGEIAKHVIDVHEDTDVTALAHGMLQRGAFTRQVD